MCTPRICFIYLSLLFKWIIIRNALVHSTGRSWLEIWSTGFYYTGTRLTILQYHKTRSGRGACYIHHWIACVILSKNPNQNIHIVPVILLWHRCKLLTINAVHRVMRLFFYRTYTPNGAVSDRSVIPTDLMTWPGGLRLTTEHVDLAADDWSPDSLMYLSDFHSQHIIRTSRSKLYDFLRHGPHFTNIIIVYYIVSGCVRTPFNCQTPPA